MQSGKNKIRGAVIGYGGAFGMGRQHGNHMVAAGFDFVAACDTDAARMEAAVVENPGIRTYLDYRDLLKDDGVDLVTVILPHNLHAEVAIACSEAGKHVIVEKPMCLSSAEADAMIAAAKKAGKMLSVYQNRRWDGDFNTIKKLIMEGMIGDIVSLELSMGGFGKPGDWWRSDKAIAGGILFDWGAHCIDWTLALVRSDVAGVFGHLYNGAWPSSTIEDHGAAIIRFKNGVLAEITVSQVASIHRPMWRILGTKGGLTCHWGEPVTVKVDHNGHLAEFKVDRGQDKWDGYYGNIADHLYNGADLVCKPEESRRIISIIEAAERSAASGQVEMPV